MASATTDAIQSCPDVHERGLDWVEKIVERSLDRVEWRLRLLLLLGLGQGRGTRSDVDNIRDAHVGPEDCRFARIEPGVTEQGGAVVVGRRDVVFQIGLPHRFYGLIGGHAGLERAGATTALRGTSDYQQCQGAQPPAPYDDSHMNGFSA